MDGINELNDAIRDLKRIKEKKEKLFAEKQQLMRKLQDNEMELQKSCAEKDEKYIFIMERLLGLVEDGIVELKRQDVLEKVEETQQNILEKMEETQQNILEKMEETQQKGLEKIQEDMKKSREDEDEAQKMIKELEGQLEEKEKQLQKQKGVLEELDKVKEYYFIYRSWGGNKEASIGAKIKDTSFLDFLVACSENRILPYIYDNVEVLLRKGAEPQAIDAVNAVIDCCIFLYNRKGKTQLTRQRTDVGDSFEQALHNKNERGSYTGKVEKVLLAGVLSEGRVYENCKAFVDVTE